MTTCAACGEELTAPYLSLRIFAIDSDALIADGLLHGLNQACFDNWFLDHARIDAALERASVPLRLELEVKTNLGNVVPIGGAAWAEAHNRGSDGRRAPRSTDGGP